MAMMCVHAVYPAGAISPARHTGYSQGSVAKLRVQAHAPLLGASDELIIVGARRLEVHDCNIAHLEWPASCHLHRRTQR